MANNIDMSELLRLQEQIGKLADKQNKVAEDSCKELARQMIARTVKKTPVSSGELRRNWTTTPIKNTSDGCEITILNNTSYAPYVEYGHRQEPGRFVPALGKRLVKSWVPGQFMMTRSAEEVERIAPKVVEKNLEKHLKEAGL